MNRASNRPKPPTRSELRVLWALAALSVVLSGGCCQGSLDRASAGTAALNSERIRQQFGNYGIEVLQQDAQLRVTNLYSTEPEGRICRTLAVVSFNVQAPIELAAAHDEILAGGSIGTVLSSNGWRVVKRRLALHEIKVGVESRAATLMQLSGSRLLAADLYELAAERDGATLSYAIIAEIHHPDFMSISRLRALRLPQGEHSGTAHLRRLAERIATESPRSP